MRAAWIPAGADAAATLFRRLVNEVLSQRGPSEPEPLHLGGGRLSSIVSASGARICSDARFVISFCCKKRGRCRIPFCSAHRTPLRALIQDGLVIAEGPFAIDLHVLSDFQHILAEPLKQRKLQHRAEHRDAAALPDAVLLGEQEQVRCRMGGAIDREIAFLHHEYPGEIRRQVADLIIAGGVHVLRIGEVFPSLCLVLFGVVEMSGQNLHKIVELTHSYAPFSGGPIVEGGM